MIDVAYVSGIDINLISVHTASAQETVVLNYNGAHFLEGGSYFHKLRQR